MSYIHKRSHVDAGGVISVQCSHQINVLVMNDSDYRAYKQGRNFDYHGGFFTHFPANITVPCSGYWNIVLALPSGRRATIRHSISIL
ncbi:DUF1883 domain-containing protein [Enterobacter hormaechei]|uniref:DUF1883 domain-containing protein n=1 Tax=Enterobacter hormaechei TaxID=158836 RepID=UPI002A750D0E|nr:DUF1883 domain-containing protein [Enterobacter hormaechei]MDY3570236.1 DUF1883 domain-containing protein [Enterobacter hormaechei]